jgi:hypothetical protein
MASAKFTLAEAEERILRTEEGLEPTWRLPYLEKGYWHKSASRVHWCSFDIAKFYPSVSLEHACRILILRSLMAQVIGLDLLKQLSSFSMDLSSWTTQELEQMGLGRKETICPFIPTGLGVAGFLANVAMLPVDDWVRKEAQNKQIAHFRYVDDHFALAGSLKSLTNWLSTYRSILLSETGCKLKDEKTEPEFLRQYLREECTKAKAISATSLDPEFPTPLMTETLAKISDLSRLNFNLLDRDNQQRVLHDLHHLLVTEFPDEEVAQKTRITFAATLIARLTPLVEEADGALSRMIIRRAELTKLIGDAQKRLNSLRRRSKLHILENENFNLYNRELRTLSSRIGTFNRSLAESHERRNNRALNLLLRALMLHPEKLRLWERTLDFLRNTGKNAEHIRKHVALVAEKNPLAAVLVRAKILQIICKHAFISVRVFSAGDLPLDVRKNALHYLLSTARLAVDPIFETKTYYERISARFADVAFSAVFDILRGLVATPGEFNERERDEFRRISGQQRWVKAWPFSNDELWWIGRQLANISPKPDSPLVAREISRLPSREIATWQIWSVFDEPIPLNGLRLLAKNPAVTSVSDEGWLAEAVFTHRKAARYLKRARNIEISRISRVLASKSGEMLLLPDWILWTANPVRDANDPRLSEWTALEIIRQISSALEKLAPESRHVAVSCVFNFRIPKAWQDESSKLTWEQWKMFLAKQSEVTVRLRDQFQDARTVPATADFSEIGYEFSSVRGLGVLLLSLLRRDFRIPKIGGNMSMAGTLGKLAIRYVQNRPCSSRTMAVLEACLMDRNTETFMLVHRGASKDELAADTAHDVPLINTIAELRSEIVLCQSILTVYQSTISAHEPRQLVPLYLGQYTSKNWKQTPDVLEVDADDA